MAWKSQMVQQCQRFWLHRRRRQRDDIFAHYSTIVMDGYKTLKAGQDVTFELQQV